MLELARSAAFVVMLLMAAYGVTGVLIMFYLAGLHAWAWFENFVQTPDSIDD